MPTRELLESLPAPEELRRRSIVLAALDAVMTTGSPKYVYRPGWRADESLASMDNGAGDEYSIIFGPKGTYVRGFDHESEMNTYDQVDAALWPGLTDHLPAVFRSYIDDFTLDGVPTMTVCLWWAVGDSSWNCSDFAYPDGDVYADGASWMFGALTDWTLEDFLGHATYYGCEMSPALAHHLMASLPLTEEHIAALNPRADATEALAKIEALRYPVQ
ncbi:MULTISPECIES: hypothetical protein [unclassified Rhodococcus (in: high G+C Gram-positive bacteria)]|jgi:hypothetical protein|uniref:hypothetical protein n=1 Tax=unclassified Rhodococcus (in: high G+C Gram-positive bacteria) TaxID=192944 RepID=UPI000BC3B52E|nr:MULTISPECIES: hypothetical protein [unclassified Rhodococcus (in: high G+C Gram-positive bacteria)]MBP1162040.1 hypothetical protein [Rhodococcus sp. PvR099]PTR43250.1 hypothetical protein C8K38_108121 [Rhodococcus sp. OK611]SNX91113.1 hypothetical protein SAMN05447004_108119 [Rhodococcus sp. OK270]